MRRLGLSDAELAGFAACRAVLLVGLVCVFLERALVWRGR